MLNRRDTLKLFASMGVAGAAAPLLSACTGTGGSGSGSNAPVRVAFIYPQSGAVHNMGDEMRAGFELYLQQHNHLLGGRPAQVSYVDEGGSSDEGQAAVAGVLKGTGNTPTPDVIVGIGSSAVMAAVRDSIEKAQIPLIGANGSPANMLSPKYIWRVSYVDGDAGGVLANYFNQRQIDHVYVYDDGSVDGKTEADAFRSTFKQTQSSQSGNMNQALNEIQNGNARVVVAACNGAAASSFLKAYRNAQIKLPLYGPGFLTEGFVVEDKTVAAAARDVYTVLNYAPDLDNDANRQFASQYFGQHPKSEPSTYAMASYDALNVLDRAISLIKGDVNAHAINSALGGVGQFDSPRGQWQFNQSRTPQQTWYLRQFIKDGRVWQNNAIQRLDTPTLTA
jgi:branched-chain amino acid transport system substrate-binding protein